MAPHSSVLAWRIPGTGEAWWAAVYGVAQSWTRLKRLSSSSSSKAVRTFCTPRVFPLFCKMRSPKAVWTFCTPRVFTLLLLLLSRFSHVRLLATPWTVAHQASPSMGFSRQEYWSGVPLPSPPHSFRRPHFKEPL